MKLTLILNSLTFIVCKYLREICQRPYSHSEKFLFYNTAVSQSMHPHTPFTKNIPQLSA